MDEMKFFCFGCREWSPEAQEDPQQTTMYLICPKCGHRMSDADHAHETAKNRFLTSLTTGITDEGLNPSHHFSFPQGHSFRIPSLKPRYGRLRDPELFPDPSLGQTTIFPPSA